MINQCARCGWRVHFDIEGWVHTSCFLRLLFAKTYCPMRLTESEVIP